MPRARSHPSMIVLGLLLALGVVADGFVSTSAQAHATLIEATPLPDSQLDSPPPGITLKFAGELLPEADLDVVGPDGSSLEAGVAIVSGDTVIQRVSDQGGIGQYSVTYLVRSADGHEISGRLNFAVGEPVERATVTPEGSDEAGESGESAESDEDDGGGASTLLIGGATAVIAAAGVGFVLWRARGRSGSTPAERPVPPSARSRNGGTRNRR